MAGRFAQFWFVSCLAAASTLGGQTCLGGPLIGPGQDEFDRETGSVSQGDALLNYEFFRPPDHDAAGDLPLVVFLHGYSDGQASKRTRLNDTMRDLVHATQKENDQRLGRRCSAFDCDGLDEQFASYLLVPKIPIVTGWSGAYLANVRGMIEDLSNRYDIDANRIYLAGYSNGGFAVPAMFEIYPGQFAAGMPISGGASPNPSTLAALHEAPLWFFHGASDGVVDPSFSADLYDALIADGHPDVHLSLPAGGHDAGFQFAFRDYDNQHFPWLFSQSLGTAVPTPSGVVLLIFGLAGAFRSRRS